MTALLRVPLSWDFAAPSALALVAAASDAAANANASRRRGGPEVAEGVR